MPSPIEDYALLGDTDTAGLDTATNLSPTTPGPVERRRQGG